MKQYIAAAMCLISNTASVKGGIAYRPNILRAVNHLQPALTSAEALRVAGAISQASETCVVSWEVLLAMGFVESGLRVGRMNTVTKDYGLFQINATNIRALHLDRARLLLDETYGAQAACTVLKTHKAKYAPKVSYWLGTYQAGTHLSDAHIRDLARSYDRRIRRIAKDLHENSGVCVDGGS